MSHKKLISLLLATVMLISLVGCSSEADEIIVPPNRFGTASASVNDYTFAEAVERADVIAHVRIGNWLGDDTNPDHLPNTLFEAEPIAVYKGELPDAFVLRQDGSTEDPYERYPLFTYGNELLLFMRCSASPNGYSYDNVYWIIGNFTSVYYLGKDDSGALFAVPNSTNSMHANESFENVASITPANSSVSTATAVLRHLAENDPEVWDGNSITCVLSLNDLVSQVFELTKTYDEEAVS